MLPYKQNTKISVGIKFGKGLLTSCVLVHWLQWWSAVSPVISSNVSQYYGQLIGVIRVIGVIGAITDDWTDNTEWYHYLSRMESWWYLLIYLSKEKKLRNKRSCGK